MRITSSANADRYPHDASADEKESGPVSRKYISSSRLYLFGSWETRSGSQPRTCTRVFQVREELTMRATHL